MHSFQVWDNARRMTIGVVLSALVLSGCHSRRPIALPNSTSALQQSAAFTELAAEDNVRVTLRNGRKEDFDIAEVQADALITEDGRRFPYADIAWLERKHLSKVKTLTLIAAMPFIAFFLVGLTYYLP